ALIAHSDGKALSPFAYEHHVAGVTHKVARDQANILNVSYAADRAGFARRTVDAAGVQLHHSFFIGQSAKPDRLIIGIIFLSLAHMKDCVERVAAVFQHLPGFLDRGLSEGSGDDYGLPGSGNLDCLGTLNRLITVLRLREAVDSRGQCCRSDSSTRQEFPPRRFHPSSDVQKPTKDKSAARRWLPADCLDLLRRFSRRRHSHLITPKEFNTLSF